MIWNDNEVITAEKISNNSLPTVTLYCIPGMNTTYELDKTFEELNSFFKENAVVTLVHLAVYSSKSTEGSRYDYIA